MCQRNCGTTVESALRAVPGVLNAKASFATSSAWASLDHGSSTRPEDVVEAVQDVGFDARLETTRRIYCQVEGMMCQRNCGTTVTNALMQTPKVLAAEASFRHRQAWAAVSLEDYNETLKQQIVDAIECVGFDAALIGEEDAMAQQKENEYQRDMQASSNNCSSAAASSASPPEEKNPYSDNDNAIVLSVEGMSCAVCTGKVERCLLKVPGVATAFVSLATHRAEVTYNHDSSNSDGIEALAHQCQQHVDQLGYDCKILSAGGGNSMTLADNVKTLEDAKYSELRSWRNLLILALALLVPMLCLKRQMAHLKMEGMSMEDNHHGTASTMTHVEDGNNTYTHMDDGDNSIDAMDFSSSMPTKNYHLSTACGQIVFAMAILSTLSQSLVGYRFYRGAWKAGRDMGMDALIVMGTSSSWIYSVVVWIWLLVESHTQVAPDNTTLQPTFGTGPMLLTFVTFGKFLEAYAKGKTSSALEALMKLQPSWASRIVSGLDGWEDNTVQQKRASVEEPLQAQQQELNLSALETEEVSAWDIRIGDYLRVLPGARIPADGVIVALSSASFSQKSSAQQAVAYIDESAFSGEPFPVAKSIGESVFGSSVNQLSVLVIRVTAAGSNSVLAKIVRLMEDAQRQKAPIQAYADRIASIFAPAVMGLALITFLLWVVLDRHAQSNEERLFLAFLSAISVVVVACPCALGLATPTGKGIEARRYGTKCRFIPLTILASSFCSCDGWHRGRGVARAFDQGRFGLGRDAIY
jgi:P-type Cu+ transporter